MQMSSQSLVRYKIQNIKFRIQNTKHKTQNTKYKKKNYKKLQIQIQNIKYLNENHCYRILQVRAPSQRSTDQISDFTRYQLPNKNQIPDTKYPNISGTSTRPMCSWPTFSAFSHSASSSQVCVHLHCTLYTVHCTLYKLFNCITLSLSGEIQIRGLTLMLVFFDRVDADPVLKHQVLSRPHHGLLLPLPQPHHRVHKVSGRCLQQY